MDVGFGLGQVISVKLSGNAGDLRKAVEKGSGWYDLKTAEGSVASVATVVFLRVADGEHSIRIQRLRPWGRREAPAA